jgi:hypothetical protein
MTPDPKPEPRDRERRGVLVTDPELVALSKLAAVLDELPPAARCRAVGWLQDRYVFRADPGTAGPEYPHGGP